MNGTSDVLTFGVPPDRLPQLAEFFLPSEIEHRLGQTGKDAKGNPWAMALAFVDDRAIMDRLDGVCGPQHWQNVFSLHPMGAAYGLMCGLSIRVVGLGWVTKWDTGGCRDTEDDDKRVSSMAAKATVSDAEKRAASKWGIGRYLYQLPSTFVDIEVPTDAAHGRKLRDAGWLSGKLSKKNGEMKFFWKPPGIPKEFWPRSHTPAPIAERLAKAKDLIRTAIVARKPDDNGASWESLFRLLAIPQQDNAFSPQDVATIQEFTRGELIQRLPCGMIPDIARIAFERNLLRESDYHAVMARTEELLSRELAS